jgi:predicted nucleotidyltransferase
VIKVTGANIRQNQSLERLFSSRVRIQLLSHFLLHPETRDHIRALAAQVDAQYSAVWKELNNLEEAGLLKSESLGGRRIFTLNSRYPIVPELRNIILKTVGAGDLLRGSLKDLEGIDVAFIFGSFAEGEADADSDLDIMLIGNLDVARITQVIAKIEERLDRDVNYVLLTQEDWESRRRDEDPFVTNVRDAKKIMLIGTLDDL